MPLILAIERDPDQVRQLTDVVRQRLRSELVLADSAERALAALGTRVPDLVLIPALLSPREEAILKDGLRERTAHVQTLTIPVLAPPVDQAKPRGVLSRFRREKTHPVSEMGFSPSAFADQIAAYLQRTAQDREADIPGKRQVAAPPPMGQADAARPRTSEPSDREPAPGTPAAPAAEPPVEVSGLALDALLTEDAAPLGPEESSTHELEPRVDSLPDAEAILQIGGDDLAVPPETDRADEPALTLSGDDADWAAVMASFRMDLDESESVPDEAVAELVQEAKAAEPAARGGHEEWGHVDPLQSGFVVLLARLHELMEDPDRMVA